MRITLRILSKMSNSLCHNVLLEHTGHKMELKPFISLSRKKWSINLYCIPLFLSRITFLNVSPIDVSVFSLYKLFKTT